MDTSRVLDIISGSESVEHAIGQCLFHGTCEEFELPPTGGAYDGMVWTAETPWLAQTYIPVAGLEAYVSEPDGWRLNEGIKPGRGSFWMDFAKEKLGLAYDDIDCDPHGSARSWSFKDGGHVTYGEALKALKGMGYVFQDGLASVRQQTFGDQVRTMPADWMIPGRLMICVRDRSWKLLDISTGESDLTELQYHDLERFRRAEAEGFDGVIIDDFAQHRILGNIGHRSIGLFPAVAAKMDWVELPAVSTADGPIAADGSTLEFGKALFVRNSVIGHSMSV